MTTYTEDQLRDLLELWNRNSQGLSEAQMSALTEWDGTPDEARAKIQKMVEARQTGTRPQRLSATDETFLQERGLGREGVAPVAEPSGPSNPKRSMKDRLRGKPSRG